MENDRRKKTPTPSSPTFSKTRLSIRDPRRGRVLRSGSGPVWTPIGEQMGRDKEEEIATGIEVVLTKVNKLRSPCGFYPCPSTPNPTPTTNLPCGMEIGPYLINILRFSFLYHHPGSVDVMCKVSLSPSPYSS